MRNIVMLCVLGVEGVDSVIRRAGAEDSGLGNGRQDNGVCGNRKDVPVRIRDTDESVYEHIPNIAVKERMREGDPPTYSIGQGLCKDASGQSIKVDKNAWTTVDDVEEDGASPKCEEICAKNKKCQGYMTKDGACAIFTVRAKTADERAGAKCFGTLLEWKERHTAGRKHAPPAEKEKLRAKDLLRLIVRYEEKAAKLIKFIEGAEGKTDKKGTSRGLFGRTALNLMGALGGDTQSATDHLHSADVQQVIERMRGFEKCRGMTRDLEHLDEGTSVEWKREGKEWKGKKNFGVKDLAKIYGDLLTEGDSCCDENCDITKMKMSDDQGRSFKDEDCDLTQLKRTCEPCKAACQKGEDGLPWMLYPQEFYENGNFKGPLKQQYMEDENSMRARSAFEGLGRACETMTSGLQEEKSPELSFCYNRCENAPGKVCRGLKSLARYASRAVQTTIAYDVCPASMSRDDNPETVRNDPAYQICGPFLPNYKGCSLNLEHILMRGNADEVWEKDYKMEKAFGGSACIDEQWFQKWLAHFTEAKNNNVKSQKTKEVVEYFVRSVFSPNDNADAGGLMDEDKDDIEVVKDFFQNVGKWMPMGK